MTFTDKQQKELRAAFIQESNQKAWSAAYHADSISKQLDKVLAEYTKLKEEDARLEGEIKTPEIAVDSHTKDNRDKRKSSQERRNVLAKQMQAIGQRAILRDSKPSPASTRTSRATWNSPTMQRRGSGRK
jgi:hypothetical protein